MVVVVAGVVVFWRGVVGWFWWFQFLWFWFLWFWFCMLHSTAIPEQAGHSHVRWGAAEPRGERLDPHSRAPS